MDCADCVPKVTLILARLPSVTAVEADYFAGMVQMRYDPETILSSKIIGYVARGTGFRIKDVTGKASKENDSQLSLSVAFANRPPSTVFDKYDVTRVAGNVWNVSFRISGEKASYPRTVLAELESYGGTLVPNPSQHGHDPVTRDLWDLLIRVALCISFTVPVLVLAWADLDRPPTLRGGIQLGFATIVQVVAWPMYSASIRSIVFLRRVDMNVLAAVSTIVAFIFSIVAFAFQVIHRQFSEPFFETSTLLITLIYFGRTVQAATRKSAGSAIRALDKLQDSQVDITADGVKHTIDSRLLHYGDIIHVHPGSRIVTDGVVISGASDVDESSVTGESAPVPKISGNLVIAGTINLTGILEIQVTRLLHENSLSQITKLIQSAQSSRAPLQDLADRFSAIVLPVSFGVACTVFLIWVLVDLFVKKKGTVDSVLDGLMKAIAVLVVSCPCAIGLAVGFNITV